MEATQPESQMMTDVEDPNLFRKYADLDRLRLETSLCTSPCEVQASDEAIRNGLVYPAMHGIAATLEDCQVTVSVTDK